MKSIYFLILIFFINACTTYTLVEKDKEVNVNSLYSIKTDMLMSKINIRGSKLTWLTNNGLGLDLFFFSQDIFQGGVLSTASKNDLKEYKKNMNNLEFVNYISTGLSDFGFINSKLVDVDKINTNVGEFQRFFLTLEDKTEGLRYKSVIDRHENKEILRVNGFIAPEKFYYDEYIDNYFSIMKNLIKKE